MRHWKERANERMNEWMTKLEGEVAINKKKTNK